MESSESGQKQDDSTASSPSDYSSSNTITDTVTPSACKITAARKDEKSAKIPTAQVKTTQDPSSPKALVDLDAESIILSSQSTPTASSSPSTPPVVSSYVDSPRPGSLFDTDEEELSFETASPKSITNSQDSTSSSTTLLHTSSAFETTLKSSGSPVPSHVSETPSGSLDFDDVDYISASPDSSSEYNDERD